MTRPRSTAWRAWLPDLVDGLEFASGSVRELGAYAARRVAGGRRDLRARRAFFIAAEACPECRRDHRTKRLDRDWFARRD